MVNYKLMLILIALWCIIVPVIAAPTTGVAALVGANNATLFMTGGSGDNWFEYGQSSTYLSWRTPNMSDSNYTVYGSPLLVSTKFYYRACDSTGCGAVANFTTAAATPQPQTTFGVSLNNITNGNFDTGLIARDAVQGYFWLLPIRIYSLVWGLLFFAIYVGLWIRERDMIVPVVLGLITGTFIMYSDAGLGLGIPVEFTSIAQGLTYAALAGIILAWVKRS
jgi:hypothetical protein